jgi:TIR domain
MAFTKEEVTTSLRTFKGRRDALLHEDGAAFDHNFKRFVDYCKSDPLAQRVLVPLAAKSATDLDQWWAAATQYNDPRLNFPPDPDEELSLRYRIILSVTNGSRYIPNLGIAHHKRQRDEWIELFRTLIIRPFADELSHRLGSAADLATPEARAIQAVPLSRIPSAKEVKIFLSHKTVDKPLVYRYFHALKRLGFDPWLDESNLPAGANLERGILRGFEESCSAVFFITDSFIDEKYLAAEIDYAIMQKRQKEKKFAIITLRYSKTAPVPGLLLPYIYKDVANDLEGFEAIIAALPIEPGPVRWRAGVV